MRNTAMISDITRAMRSPTYLSRVIVSAMTRCEAAPKPQTTRLASRNPSEGASVAPAAPATYRASPAYSVGLRPNRSARGPNTSCAHPNPSR